MTKKRSIRVAAVTALAAMAVACALSVGPTATASASNWNHRSDYLKFPALVNYTRCTQRHISLNGRYWWTLYYMHWAHPDAPEELDRPLPIQLHGRYRWLDCLHYHRLSSGTIPFYRHRSWIRNERTGGEVLFTQDLGIWGIEGIAGPACTTGAARSSTSGPAPGYKCRPRDVGADGARERGNGREGEAGSEHWGLLKWVDRSLGRVS
jgi:hypothetical protein